MDDTRYPASVDDTPHPVLAESMADEQPSSFDARGAFFPESRGFVVTGGNFTSVNNYHIAALVSSDFRTIPLSDLNLERDVVSSSVFHRRHGQVGARRMYSARPDGREGNVAAAVYHGKAGEQKWQEDISRLARIRHPNFLQIYAIVVSQAYSIYATIFNEDLVPLGAILAKSHAQSQAVCVYNYVYYYEELAECDQFLKEEFNTSSTSNDYTLMVRRQSQALCVDLSGSPDTFPSFPLLYPRGLWPNRGIRTVTNLKLSDEEEIIRVLELDVYHTVFMRHLWLTVEATGPIRTDKAPWRPGAIMYSDNRRYGGCGLEKRREVAWCPVKAPQWSYADGRVTEPQTSHLMANGWTRYNACEVLGGINAIIRASESAWASQANNCFAHLNVTSHKERFRFVGSIFFRVDFSWGDAEHLEDSTGYLFLCPVTQLRCGPPSCAWPTHAAYWSLDPAGAEPLSTTDQDLRFPAIRLHVSANIFSYHDSAYESLRRFHRAKGFDPDSLDVALHLGHPLLAYTSNDDGEDSESESDDDPFAPTTKLD
ncbi:hypothetical protein B0H16DRAFT_1530974 [Mycena metata]|uniref:Uncharacterized protein n=1 Tax=Mycena metata TaxID=1033252 RepID=A0AAD7JFI4_9AGAR|nr:hypothetical protein B0H16DRAFT_1530974 [Mycena metata]